MSSASYELSKNFSSRLESRLPSDLLHEMEEFEGVYEKFRGVEGWEGGEEGEEVEEGAFHDPGLSLVGMDTLQLDGGHSLGGSVAMALEKAVAKRDLVVCHTLLPRPLFEPGFSSGNKESAEEPSEEVTTPLLNSVLKRDLSDAEEEGEGEGGGASSHGNQRHSEEGVSYLNLFEQANISGSMNHGTLLLQPALNISKLLDFHSSHDLPCPQPEMSHDQPRPQPEMSHDPLLQSCDLAEASANQPTKRSVVSYLSLCQKHLGFTEGESSCAQELYGRIEEAGERGAEEAELMQCFHGDTRSGRSFQDHITALLNFEMIYRVGVAKDLLVSWKHTGSWMMTSDPSREDTPLVAYRPWMSVESCDPHVTFLERYEHAVFSHVMTNPGVTMDGLLEHFADVLRPCRLKEILTVLEHSGKIVPRTCWSRTPSLFSSDIKDSQQRRVVYFEPCEPII